MTTISRGLHTIARQRAERDLNDALSHIERGACGGWHYRDTRDRRRFCRACVALAGMRGAS